MSGGQLFAAGVVIACVFAAGVLAACVVLVPRGRRRAAELRRANERNTELWRWATERNRTLRNQVREADHRANKTATALMRLEDERDEFMRERAPRCPEMN
jgi:hypothetical protein